VGNHKQNRGIRNQTIANFDFLCFISMCTCLVLGLHTGFNFTFGVMYLYDSTGSRDSAVGIASGYRLDDRQVGVRVPVRSRIFSSLRRPDRLWTPPNLLSNGYRGLFPRGKTAGGCSWPLTSIYCQVKKNVAVYIHSPIRLRGVVLN
jgi:hypothetical protein